MRFLYFLFLLAFTSCGNTIYIVRHAEKEPVPSGASQMMANNPSLSEAGKMRSYALRDKLRHERIRYIFSTNTTRTVSTAQPLNELLGTTRIELYSSKKDSADFFITQIKSIKKGNVLVVGHSNTIDDMANQLCGKTVVNGDLKDQQYDNLFVIKRKGREYRFIRKKYGERSAD